MPRTLRDGLTRALLAASSGLLAGCHHRQPLGATSPALWPDEEHCWWAPYRTAMVPDSVAARYARAYATLGLAHAAWSHDADTAWAEGGPTLISRPAGSGMYAARVVAYREGDSTLVRLFASVSAQGTTTRGESTSVIPFCADAIREARAGLVRPDNEVRDDSLPLWRRRPVPDR